MSIVSQRRVIAVFTGDFDLTAVIEAANNSASPGQTDTVNLTSGNNTINVPTGATGLTIIMPTANAVQVTLKGANGDTGIALHLTDPSSIGIASSVTSLVLNATSALTGLRLIWS